MSLARRVAARYIEAARTPSKSPRAPSKFRPRIKQDEGWTDVTDPDGTGDFVDITEVTKEAKTKFEPGDKVKVKPSHGSPKFRGDTGTIDKYVPFGKYYVNLKENGHSVVSEDDLEPAVKARQAWTGLPGDIGGIASTQEEEQSEYSQMLEYLNQNATKFRKGHAWWVPPHNMAINTALMEMNFWYFTVEPNFARGYMPASSRLPEGIVIDPHWSSYKDRGWGHTKEAAETAIKTAKSMKTVADSVRGDLKEMETKAGVNFPDSIVSKIISDSLKIAERRWGIDNLRRRRILIPFDGSKAMELSQFDR